MGTRYHSKQKLQQTFDFLIVLPTVRCSLLLITFAGKKQVTTMHLNKWPGFMAITNFSSLNTTVLVQDLVLMHTVCHLITL